MKFLLLLFSVIVTSTTNAAFNTTTNNCDIVGASYSPDSYWPPLIGVVCGNDDDDCYEDARVWSSVAIHHYQDDDDLSWSKCQDLCEFYKDCQVINYYDDDNDDDDRKQRRRRPKCELLGTLLEEEGNLDFSNPNARTEPKHCDSSLWLEPFAALTAAGTNPNNHKKEEDPVVSLYTIPPKNNNNKDDDGGGIVVVPGYSDFEKDFGEDSDGNCDVCPEGDVWQLQENSTYCKFGTSDCSNPCPQAREGFLFWGSGLLSCPEAAEWFHGEGCCRKKETAQQEEQQQLSSPLSSLVFDSNCYISHYDYGRCRYNPQHIYQVLTPSQDVLYWGQVHGWWNMFLTPAIQKDDMLSAEQCMIACLEEGSTNCQGWEWHNEELCVLLRFSTTDSTESSSGCTLVRSDRNKHTNTSGTVVSGTFGCLNVAASIDTSDWTFAPPGATTTTTSNPSTCPTTHRQPRCTEPPSNGTWIHDTFVPDDNCVLHPFLPEELYNDCLPNRWIVLNGGSNVLIFFIQLVNLLAPIQQQQQDDGPLVDWRDTYSENIIDIVIRRPTNDENNSKKKNDNILYRRDVEFCEIDRDLPCEDTSLDFQGNRVDWENDRYGAALDEILAQAPYEEDSIRITLITGQVWSNAQVVLEALARRKKNDTTTTTTTNNNNNAWKDQQLTVYMQSMIWYPCRVEGWCELDELGSTHAKMMEKYSSDVDHLMEVAVEVCGDDNHMDCFFATHGYQGGHESLSRSARQMVHYLQNSVPSNAHFLDWNGFATQVLDGHVTPAMMALAQQMIWNTVCPVEQDDDDQDECGPTVVALSPSCHANCLELTGHDPDYYEDNDDAQCGGCPEGGWICMGQLQCDMQIVENVPYEVLSTPKKTKVEEGRTICLPDDWLSLSSNSFSAQMAATANNNNNNNCGTNRLWCGSTATGWWVGLLVFILGVTLLLLSNRFQNNNNYYCCSKKKKKKLSEEFTVVDAATTRSSSIKKQSKSNNTLPDTPQTVAETPTSNNTSPNHFDFAESSKSTAASPYLEDTTDFSDEETQLMSNTTPKKQAGDDGKVDDDLQSPLDQRALQFVPFDHADNDAVYQKQQEEDIKKEETSSKAMVISKTDEEEGFDPVIEATAVPIKPKKEYLQSLGFARLLASQHIVVGHLFAKGAIANVYFFGWGYTWVPWFFMLSGYVLTHARLNSSKHPNSSDSGILAHIAKRLSSIFPMYAVGVVVTVLIRVGKNAKLPSWGVLWGQSYLLQSWNPVWTEKALLSQCWFLSNLLLYWGLFGVLLRYTRQVSLRVGFLCLVVVSLLPWLLVLVPALHPGIENKWYSEHRWGQTDTAVDIWAVLLKFHPIFYLHIFWYGMLLAVVRHRVKEQQLSGGTASSTRILASLISGLSNTCGASLGYLGLVLLFSIPGLQPASHKLSARLSVLLPLQGMILLGLSPLASTNHRRQHRYWRMDMDPLAWLFSKLSPSWLGDASYCQYVLQFAMYDLFPLATISNPSFFFYLWGASLIAFKLIQEPMGKWWRKHLSQVEKRDTTKVKKTVAILLVLLVPTTMLASILSIAKVAYSSTKYANGNVAQASMYNTSNATTLPPFVQVAPNVVDVALNWTLKNTDDDDDNYLAVINPSLLLTTTLDGNLELIRAARAHNVTSTTTETGAGVTLQTLNFKSHVVMSRQTLEVTTNFDSWNVQDWGLNDSPLEMIDFLAHRGDEAYFQDSLCDPAPQTLSETHVLQKHVTGPEDPKLVLTNKDNSSWGLTFSSLPPESLLRNNNNNDDECHMQMFWLQQGPLLVPDEMESFYWNKEEQQEEPQGIHLNCDTLDRDEKNWIAFTHKEDGQLYFIYSLEPHVVVQVRPADGACRVQYSTFTPALAAVEFDLRGSATAIRWNEEEYLAAFHTPPPYRTVLYTFDAQPPFAIRRISSKPLPLSTQSFVSSLQVHSDKVWIAYGQADESSRLLVLSQDVVEQNYFGNNDEC